MIEVLNKKEFEWKIRVSFAGNIIPKTYISPDIRFNDPGWGSEIFNRKIEKVEFFFPTGHRLILSGMEKYNFFLEAAQDLGGKDSGKIKILAFWFCGKLFNSNIVEAWKINIPQTFEEQGKVIRDQKIFGHEWNGGPTAGWKKGINNKLISAIVQ